PVRGRSGVRALCTVSALPMRLLVGVRGTDRQGDTDGEEEAEHDRLAGAPPRSLARLGHRLLRGGDVGPGALHRDEQHAGGKSGDEPHDNAADRGAHSRVHCPSVSLCNRLVTYRQYRRVCSMGTRGPGRTSRIRSWCSLSVASASSAVYAYRRIGLSRASKSPTMWISTSASWNRR